MAAGFVAYSLAHAKFRLSRLEPALFAVVRDFAWSYEDDAPPGDPLALARAWQAEWLAGSGDVRALEAAASAPVPAGISAVAEPGRPCCEAS